MFYSTLMVILTADLIVPYFALWCTHLVAQTTHLKWVDPRYISVCVSIFLKGLDTATLTQSPLLLPVFGM